jgi:hypothetical protein
MSSIVPKVRFAVKCQLLRWLRRCTDAGLKTRLVPGRWASAARTRASAARSST